MPVDFKIERRGMEVNHHGGEQFIWTDYPVVPTDKVSIW